MQRKMFRIEQTFGARHATAGADARRAADAREAPGVPLNGARDAPLRRELAAIQDIIAGHKRELAAIIGDGQERRIARAAGELGAAIDGMDKATQNILDAAEYIDNSARALGATLKAENERLLAEDLQDHVVRIYEACNFQDLAGQRIGKVIALLAAIEQQLGAMLARCNGDEAPVGGAANPGSRQDLINGPRLDGDSGHASQRDIDAMFR